MKAANQVVLFGKQLFSIRYVYSGSDFKPCSHGGSDLRPTHNATTSRCFNSRSHDGSDSGNHADLPAGESFNPCSHEGSDCPAGPALNVPDPVSTHAPTKGATIAIKTISMHIVCFNPRSHEGSDSNFSQKFLPILSCNQQIIVFYN